MQHTLAKIFGKPNDYKICKKCGALNWYENKECINCGFAYFYEDGKNVDSYVENEYSLYKEKYSLKEEEIDNILIEV